MLAGDLLGVRAGLDHYTRQITIAHEISHHALDAMGANPADATELEWLCDDAAAAILAPREALVVMAAYAAGWPTLVATFATLRPDLLALRLLRHAPDLADRLLR